MSDHKSRTEEHKRESRMDESRRLEERINFLRPMLKMVSKSPLDIIDKSKTPYGWTYGWIRFRTKDEPDFKRDLETRREGWTPVPADRHPEFALEGVSGLKSSDNTIQYLDLILCEIPTVIYEEKRKQEASFAQQVVTSLPGVDSLMNEPGMPVRVLANETTNTASFGGR